MIYFIREEIMPGRFTDFVKIGCSENADQRRTQLQTGNPRKLEIVCEIPGTAEDETALHTLLARDREGGEWFRWSPGLAHIIKCMC